MPKILIASARPCAKPNPTRTSAHFEAWKIHVKNSLPQFCKSFHIDLTHEHILIYIPKGVSKQKKQQRSQRAYIIHMCFPLLCICMHLCILQTQHTFHILEKYASKSSCVLCAVNGESRRTPSRIASGSGLKYVPINWAKA